MGLRRSRRDDAGLGRRPAAGDRGRGGAADRQHAGAPCSRRRRPTNDRSTRAAAFSGAVPDRRDGPTLTGGQDHGPVRWRRCVRPAGTVRASPVTWYRARSGTERTARRIGRMPQRLTPLEVSMLALDTAHTPGHVGTVDIFDPGPEGFDYERLIGADRGADLLRAALPAAGPRRPGPVSPARSGSTTRTSTSPSTSAARRCRGRAPWTSCASSSAGCWPAGSTAPGRCGRCTWSRAWRATGSRWSTKSHLSLVDGIDTVDLGQVLLDTVEHTDAMPSGSADRGLAPAARADPAGAGRGRAAGRALQDPGRRWRTSADVLTGALGVAIAVGEVGRRSQRRARRAGRRRAARRPAAGRAPRSAGWCRNSAGSPSSACRWPTSRPSRQRARAHHQRRRARGDHRAGCGPGC